MAQRKFRTEQAITAFTKCLGCKTLPPNKISEVNNQLSVAKARLDQQNADVSDQ